MSVFRLLFRTPLFFIYLILGLIIIAISSIFLGRNWQNSLAGQAIIKRWMNGLTHILGIKINTIGTCIAKPSLLVSNHVSWLDIIVMGSRCHTTFLAKSEVKSWPIFGKLAEKSGTLFVNRNSKSSLSDARNVINDSLWAGRSVAIFPEGTTTNGRSLKPFKSSFYQSAIEVGVPVQSIAIQYPSIGENNQHVPYIDDDVFVTHLLRVLKSKHTKVNLFFCGPVKNQLNYTRKELAELTQKQIDSVLNIAA